MNLFDITTGIENACSEKTRAANEREVKAYFQWQRERHGLADLEGCDLRWAEFNHGRTRTTLHRVCIGATIGKTTCKPVRTDSGIYQPAQYENGAYSIIMPGWNAHRQGITMETLNDAGEIVASQTLPVEPKKGGIIWDKAAVHRAVGPVAKPAKASKRKASPTPVIYAKPERVRSVSRIIGNLQYGRMQEDAFVVGQGGAFPHCEGGQLDRWYMQREGRETVHGDGYATRDEAVAAVDALIASETAPQEPQEHAEAPCLVMDSQEPVSCAGEVVADPEPVAVDDRETYTSAVVDHEAPELDTQGDCMAAFIGAMEPVMEPVRGALPAVSTPTMAERGRQPMLGERIKITQPGYEGEVATVIAESSISRYAMRHSLIALTDTSRHLKLGLMGENWEPLVTAGEPQETADAPANTPISHAKRSPAHERAIRRAWRLRRDRRIFREAAERSIDDLLHVQSEYRRSNAEYEREIAGYDARLDKHNAYERTLEAKRRRSTLLARQRGKNMVQIAKVARERIDEEQAALAKAKQSPTYFDETGMERRDVAAVAFDQGRHALDKAETLGRQLAEAKAAVARQQVSIETLSGEYEAMAMRAIKAERALAAVEARANGHPPAVRSVGVNFRLAS